MSSAAASEAPSRPFNRETRSLIRHRCEAEVRRRLLRWIGLPIGGTGAIAFFAALLVWIPEQVRKADLAEFGHDLLSSHVQTVMSTDVAFQRLLETNVQRIIAERAKQELARHIAEASSRKVEAVLAQEVRRSVSGEIDDLLQGPELAAEVGSAVAETLQADQYGVLRTALRPALQSIAQGIAGTVSQNAAKAVEEVENPLPESQIISKSNFGHLEQVLDELASRPLPEGDFALRFYMAAGSGQTGGYEPYAIVEYLYRLTEVLGSQLRYILILDWQGRFVALADAAGFFATVESRPDELAGVLNDPSLDLMAGRQLMEDLLGPGVLGRISASLTLREALRSDTLAGTAGGPEQMDRRVAVVDEADGLRWFRGVTSRRRLLASLLP